MDLNVMEFPIAVKVELDDGWIRLEKNADTWQGGGVELTLRSTPGKHSWVLSAPEVSVKRVLMRWNHGIRGGVKLYGDHWERAYGDLEWRGIVPDRIMPWYFLVHDGQRTFGIGVKTGTSSLCHWEMDDRGVTLMANVMCGPKGVKLGQRELTFAQIVQYQSQEGESAHESAQALCRLMCPNPILPDHPIYGGNNWYYAFGQFRPEDAMADSLFMAELTGDNAVRPYMVLDDGWQMNGGSYSANGGPWTGNRFFPDMKRLAEDMTAAGVAPGIWCRPLLTFERVPENWALPSSIGKVLDPSIPEVLELVASDIRRMHDWGYRLIKHDFSTFDILNEWGNSLGANPSRQAQLFHDQSRTTAEIIVDLYRTIAEAAGTSLVMGCNTISHLAAGLFAIQRTGDDVSGVGWERTRRMGVNTLGFRMHQHGTLYSHDADCVGITASTPWNYAKQWLDLVARSGTPLFMSVSPSLATEEQKRRIKEAFQIAVTVGQHQAVPLDWLDNNCPSRWQFGAETIEYDWYGDSGVRNEDKDNTWWR
ncbi:hypothetical protein [Cohnella soli]|uniref:Alpha-galactosidase n=1 Tax=Cohnella soli TaxID=425005 RepID=A0ABW0HYF2_9BACL